MNWVFSTKQKVKTALVLTVILASIMAKNWVDERNVSRLGNSFASVYEDRLLAESYIYKLSDHLYQKKIMADHCSSQENRQNLLVQMAGHNAAIRQLVGDYEQTNLTPAERVLFQNFKNNVRAISALEAAYLGTGQQQAPFPTQTRLNHEYETAAGHLHQLSEIQVSEGKVLKDQSQRIMAGSTLLKHFELALILILGILIQVLIFATRMKIPKIPYKPGLN